MPRRAHLPLALRGFLLASALLLSCAVAAYADAPGTASLNLVPLNAQHRGIALRAQTVEATIYEDDNGVWADTDVWYRLHNPDSRPITVTVALPGPQAFPADLPADIALQLGEQPVALLTGEGADGAGPILWARLAMPPHRSVDVRLSYRQALPVRDDMVIFAYMSTASKQWARSPEGVKLQMRFRTPVAPESILAVAPAPSSSDRGSMTWQWEGEKNLTNVGLALMRPGWWTAFQAEREAASSPEAALADFVALAVRYEQLARLPLLPFQNSDFFDRFYPSAVSTLEGSVAAQAAAQSPESAAVFAALTTLYDQRAARAQDEEARYRYAQLASAAAMRAVAAGEADAALRTHAMESAEKVLALAEAKGDLETVRELRAQLDVLRAGADGLTREDRERSARLRDVSLLLQQRDYPAARQLLREHLASESPARELPAPPLISSLQITVTTAPGLRRYQATARDGEGPGSAHALLAAVAAARPGAGRIVLDGETLTLDIPGSQSADLRATQRAVAADLPDLPELALLRDALQPADLALTTTEEPLRHVGTYVEAVALAASAAVWSANAAGLADMAATMTPASGEADHADDPDALLAQIMAHDAESWRRLGESSSVHYVVTLGAAPEAQRTWSARPGDNLSLRFSTGRWREEQLRIAGAGAIAGAVILAGAITGALMVLGHLARRPRGRRA